MTGTNTTTGEPGIDLDAVRQSQPARETQPETSTRYRCWLCFSTDIERGDGNGWPYKCGNCGTHHRDYQLVDTHHDDLPDQSPAQRLAAAYAEHGTIVAAAAATGYSESRTAVYLERLGIHDPADTHVAIVSALDEMDPEDLGLRPVGDAERDTA